MKPEHTSAEITKCACRVIDPHDCWALRYFGRIDVSGAAVDDDGGPCECACHGEHQDLYDKD